ncbi:conserved protein, unknown function, partial [Hepatocystis sp. ex Piliocolobus tephrosceles]
KKKKKNKNKSKEDKNNSICLSNYDYNMMSRILGTHNDIREYQYEKIYKMCYKKIKELKSNAFIKNFRNCERYIKKNIFNYLSKNNIICNLNADSVFIYLKNVYYLIIKNNKLMFYFIYNKKDVMNAIVMQEQHNNISYKDKDFFLYFLIYEKKIYEQLFNKMNLNYEQHELVNRLKMLKQKLKEQRFKEIKYLFEESMHHVYLVNNTEIGTIDTTDTNATSNTADKNNLHTNAIYNKRFSN